MTFGTCLLQSVCRTTQHKRITIKRTLLFFSFVSFATTGSILLRFTFKLRCCRDTTRIHCSISHIPYLIFIVSNPCCPNKISFMKLNNPSHTTGVISTPNAGGTDPLTKRRSGSVGQTIRLNGSSLTFAVGYHERTIRHSCASVQDEA